MLVKRMSKTLKQEINYLNKNVKFGVMESGHVTLTFLTCQFKEDVAIIHHCVKFDCKQDYNEMAAFIAMLNWNRRVGNQ